MNVICLWFIGFHIRRIHRGVSNTKSEDHNASKISQRLKFVFDTLCRKAHANRMVSDEITFD